MITYLNNQGGYKERYFKKISYDDIRPIFERVWDHVNTFIPIGSEVEKDSSKPSERETSKIVEEEKVEEEDVNPEPVLIKKRVVGIRRKTLARRKASDKQGQDSSKRQKKEKEIADYEEEKDELRMWLTVVPDEEAIIDLEVLHTKFPIVDWESQSLGNMHVYKIIRADGNTSYHKTFEMLMKFSYARSDSLLLTPLCCDDIHDVTPRVFTLAGCDRLVSEPLVIEKVEVGDKVMLEVSSWEDVVHFGKKEMLAPRYKYLADTNLHVHLEEIKVDDTLRFVEEPVEMIDYEVKSLKRSRILIVKSIGTRSEVKCKYETRNMGNGPNNEENTDSYETLRHNTYDNVTP
ncbi:hypothetical protein Tco_0681239 [Tanacetum coccineum]|uniref:Uncharacterized protein n=1 Tax=Tanacetum coccineum TaxID=301880 RepID=A0ABQ4XN00_9ASTR